MSSETEINYNHSNEAEQKWRKLFRWSSSPYHGYVFDEEQVKDVIRQYEIETITKYVDPTRRGDYGLANPSPDKLQDKDVHWEDTQANAVPHITPDGIPFIILGKKTLSCQHGKQRSKKRRLQIISSECDLDARQQSKRGPQNSKKMNCTATLRIRHILKFPEFKLSLTATKSEKDRMTRKVKAALKSDDPLLQHVFYVQLPSPSDHDKHVTGDDAGFFQPIDEELKAVINDLVTHRDVVTISEVKKLLQQHLKEVMFHGQPLPPRTNHRFWPSNKTIYNYIYHSLRKLRKTPQSQAIGAKLMEEWKFDYTDESFVSCENYRGHQEVLPDHHLKGATVATCSNTDVTSSRNKLIDLLDIVRDWALKCDDAEYLKKAAHCMTNGLEWLYKSLEDRPHLDSEADRSTKGLVKDDSAAGMKDLIDQVHFLEDHESDLLKRKGANQSNSSWKKSTYVNLPASVPQTDFSFMENPSPQGISLHSPISASLSPDHLPSVQLSRLSSGVQVSHSSVNFDL